MAEQQRYRAVVSLPFDEQIVQGMKLEGFVVQHVVRDPFTEQTKVVIEGPTLPAWTVGAIPYHLNGLEELKAYLKDKPTVCRGR